MKLIDLTGNRYGKLTVIKRDFSHKVKNKRTFWLCRCDCGNTKIVDGQKLKAGTTKSCGCTQYKYDFNETREIGDVLYIKAGDREVIIDKEDLSKIYPNRVCVNGSGYALCHRNRLVHRMIIDCPKGFMIDHINHNPLDNRKCNLRIVSNSENQLNRRMTSNTGEYGITLCKNGYYRITVDDKYCGIRKTLADAIIRRDECLVGTKQMEYNYYLRKQKGVENAKEG